MVYITSCTFRTVTEYNKNAIPSYSLSKSCMILYIQILELCFENLQSPTVYAAAGAMLSSFSTGGRLLHTSFLFKQIFPPFYYLETHYSFFRFRLISVLLYNLGRPTSLIIDFGARATRIIPVVDGFTLNKSIVSTNRGGNWIDVEVKNEIDRSGMVCSLLYIRVAETTKYRTE
jgi:actin-related protein